MATSLTIPVAEASVHWTFTKDDDYGGKTANSNAVVASSPLAPGTGSGQASKFYATTLTVNALAAGTIGLGSSLADFFSGSQTFSAVKGFFVRVTGANVRVTTDDDGWPSGPLDVEPESLPGGIVVRAGYTFAVYGGGAGYANDAVTLYFRNLSATDTATVTVVFYGV